MTGAGGSCCFLLIVYSLNEHKVNIGEIGKGAQPATSPEIQERHMERVPIRKEKLELDQWKLKFERMLRETEVQTHH